MTPDLLTGAASAVTVVDRITAFARHVFRRVSADADLGRPFIQPAAKLRAPSPLGIELLPVSFEVGLNREIPRIMISLYAVNYCKDPLHLRFATVFQFQLSGGPFLENISLPAEYSVAPQRSMLITCRRALIDSEIRAIAQGRSESLNSAVVSIRARGVVRKRELEFEHFNQQVIGLVTGNPPFGAA